MSNRVIITPQTKFARVYIGITIGHSLWAISLFAYIQQVCGVKYFHNSGENGMKLDTCNLHEMQKAHFTLRTSHHWDLCSTGAAGRCRRWPGTAGTGRGRQVGLDWSPPGTSPAQPRGSTPSGGNCGIHIVAQLLYIHGSIDDHNPYNVLI